jgi:hypothetical protein
LRYFTSIFRSQFNINLDIPLKGEYIIFPTSFEVRLLDCFFIMNNCADISCKKNGGFLDNQKKRYVDNFYNVHLR